ncbi:MAG TPA: YegP family protein [Flavobacteriales bacterium]|nr:YegP family protein [Flavobacteriales bacterium]MCB0788276.1 YegP family protein [Flavobacteriales bacterium]HOP41977.1 YegP family protein [Flavobacteriales bacterium]HPF68639.1 YegP family protein [Flavobacteriales bacterium]HPQ58055.1 YegP family protein [Flavobacteriales bacterium]
MANGKFIVKTDKAGEYRFNLVAGNGQVILSSEGYVQKASCMNGIESVRKHAGDDGRYERTIAANGKHHFNLKAANGQVIGTSQLYADKDGMENGIRSVATHAPDAAVVEE